MLRSIVAPLLIFVIVGGLLGYGVAVYLWRAQGNEGVPPLDSIPQTTITATASPTPDATVSPSVTASPSTTPSPTPTVEPVQLGVSVSVLNGAGIAGIAGDNQAELEAAGFTAVTAGNLTGAKPPSNTVTYSDAALETTAARVAEVLGISNVERGVPVDGDITVPDGGIAVVLVTDPAA